MTDNKTIEHDLMALKRMSERAIVKMKRSVRLSNAQEPTNIYMDMRLVTQDPRGLGIIGGLGCEVIRRYARGASAVGGPSTGAIPVSTAISLSSLERGRVLNTFWVRKEAKKHGLGKILEGPSVDGKQVVVIDDVVTTGKSSLNAKEAAEKAGAKVVLFMSIVDRMEGASDLLRKDGTPYFRFFELDKERAKLNFGSGV